MGIRSGALISANAYELVPESVLGGATGMGVAFMLGGAVFFIGDWLIDHSGGAERKDIAGDQPGRSGAAIFVGSLLDNIPESIILGMSVTLGGAINIAFLAAVFVSNLPEGLAGSVNYEAAGRTRRNIFWLWMMVVLISGASAALGYAVVFRLPSTQGLYAQAFAAGAMLTMLADAMMPEAFEHGANTVGLFSVLGFLLAAVLSFMGSLHKLDRIPDIERCI